MQIAAGIIVTCITITSIATASVTNADKREENTKSAGNAIIAEDVEGDAKAEDAESAIFPVTIPTLVFQIVMLFSTFYFGMLFTNWGNITLDKETTQNIFEDSTPYAPMWIKIVTLRLTIALFTLSMTMKICCPDRIV